MTTPALLRDLHDALVTSLLAIGPEHVQAWLHQHEFNIGVLEQGDPVLAREIRERAEQRRER